MKFPLILCLFLISNILCENMTPEILKEKLTKFQKGIKRLSLKFNQRNPTWVDKSWKFLPLF